MEQIKLYLILTRLSYEFILWLGYVTLTKWEYNYMSLSMWIYIQSYIAYTVYKEIYIYIYITLSRLWYMTLSKLGYKWSY